MEHGHVNTLGRSFSGSRTKHNRSFSMGVGEQSFNPVSLYSNPRSQAQSPSSPQRLGYQTKPMKEKRRSSGGMYSPFKSYTGKVRSIGKRSAANGKRPGLFSIFSGRSNNIGKSDKESPVHSPSISRGQSKLDLQKFEQLLTEYKLTSEECWRKAFFDCIIEGDESKVRLLWEFTTVNPGNVLPNRIDLDKLRDPGNGNTALIEACSHNRHTIAAMIMYEFRGSPMLENNFQSTALHYACSGGWTECVVLLLEFPRVARECKDKRDFFGYSCLHLAVMGGHYKIVEILIHAGANMELPVLNRGVRAMHLAVGRWDLEMLELLRSRGNANISSKDDDHATPLMRAIVLFNEKSTAELDRKIEVLEYLLGHTRAKLMTLSRHRQGNRNLLQIAAEAGCDSFFPVFFDIASTSASVQLLKDQTDSKSSTCLHYATKTCNVKCIDSILQHLFNLNLIADDETRASKSKKKRSKKSKKSSNDPKNCLDDVLNARDNKGNTVLHSVLLELKNMENALNPSMSVKLRESVMRKYPKNLLDFLKRQDLYIQLAQKFIDAGSSLKVKNKVPGTSAKYLAESLGLHELLPDPRDSFHGLFRLSRNLKLCSNSSSINKRSTRSSIRVSVSLHVDQDIETCDSENGAEDDESTTVGSPASALSNVAGQRGSSSIDQLQISNSAFLSSNDARRSRRNGAGLLRVASFLRSSAQTITSMPRRRESGIKISM